MTRVVETDQGDDIVLLVENSKVLGELRYRRHLESLGTVLCLPPEVSLAELCRALERAGLTFSTVDDVQLIHRAPKGAA